MHFKITMQSVECRSAEIQLLGVVFSAVHFLLLHRLLTDWFSYCVTVESVNNPTKFYATSL